MLEQRMNEKNQRNSATIHQTPNRKNGKNQFNFVDKREKHSNEKEEKAEPICNKNQQHRHASNRAAE